MFKTQLDKDIVLFGTMIILAAITAAGFPGLSSLLLISGFIVIQILKIKGAEKARQEIKNKILKRTHGPIGFGFSKTEKKYENYKNYVKENNSLKKIGNGIINKISGYLNFYTMELSRTIPWLFCCIPAPTPTGQLVFLLVSVFMVAAFRLLIAWSNQTKAEKPPLFHFRKSASNQNKKG